MTRREQYHFRRKRYQRRAQGMYKMGFIYVRTLPVPGMPFYTTHRIGRKTPLWSTGVKQRPMQIKHPPKHLFPEIGVVIGNHAEIVPAKQHVPPIARWIGLSAAAVADALPSHQRVSAINYHGRRINRVPHKPDRMNGFQRSCWGAAHVAYSQGYFPDWDPLQRHPTFAEFELGDVYSGPFPQTPP